jgi:hypothetical protein
MMKIIDRPISVNKAIKNLKQDAHERVMDRGLVQFRLDKNYMQRLLKMSDEKGLGYGVLARMWICERLEQESSVAPSPLKQIRNLVRQEVQVALKSNQFKKRKVG